MNTDRIDMQELARAACGIAPSPTMEDHDETKALAAELRQRTKERDAWATHCRRAEADAAALLVERDALQARLDATLDMRGLVGELRQIKSELDRLNSAGHSNARRQLSDVLRRIDRESQ